MSWRDWAGYFAVSTYEVHYEREYNAIRNAGEGDPRARVAAIRVQVQAVDKARRGAIRPAGPSP